MNYSLWSVWGSSCSNVTFPFWWQAGFSEKILFSSAVFRSRIVCFWASWIRIHNLLVQFRIRLRNRFLPSTNKQMKKNLDFYCFAWWLFIFEELCKCTIPSKGISTKTAFGSVKKCHVSGKLLFSHLFRHYKIPFRYKKNDLENCIFFHVGTG
jgi:hypothetical protein